MKKMQKTFFALGTANTVSVFYDEGREIQINNTLNKIKSRILMFDDMFSVFKKDSEISKINSAAGKSLVQICPQTYEIIKKSVEFSKKTNGAFDISAGSLSRLWKNAAKTKKVPDMDEIKRHAGLTNYKDIILKDNKAGLRRAGQELDLGGIAKGYAADEAKRILKEENITNAIINFGGTIIAMGDEKQIGIQNPDAKTGTYIGTVIIQNKAVVTSGLYERFFINNGNLYHHIIDTKTGMPSKSGLISVTVIGDSAYEMDALATSVFIMGLKEGIKLAYAFHVEAVFIDENKDVFLTRGLENNFLKYREMV
jgi:thiamine biosynthesis lipoprotein